MKEKIDILKSLLSRKETKTILANYSSLAFIQGTNFILPLIVLPYLVTVVGIEKCGLVFLAQAFMQYWIILTDYGFNLSTTREIAMHRDDAEKLSQIVTYTLVTKLILCVVAFLLFLLVVNLFTEFSSHSSLYYWSFTLVLGQALIPLWFFQGIEKMKYLTFLNLGSKIVFTLLIFVFVKSPGDYIYVAVFYGAGNLVAGLAGLWLVFTKFGIRFRSLSQYNLVKELTKGWYIFLSTFSITVYSNSSLVILGFFASDMVVGYYSIADKVIYAARQLEGFFFQATYPQVCTQILKGHQYVKRFFRHYYIPFGIALTLFCILLFVLADFITVLLAKKQIPEITNVIRVLSIVPLIVFLKTPFFQTLLAYNRQKSYMAVFAAGSILNIILNIILAHYYKINGTVAAVLCTEIFITAGMYKVLHSRHSDIAILGTPKKLQN